MRLSEKLGHFTLFGNAQTSCINVGAQFLSSRERRIPEPRPEIRQEILDLRWVINSPVLHTQIGPSRMASFSSPHSPFPAGNYNQPWILLDFRLRASEVPRGLWPLLPAIGAIGFYRPGVHCFIFQGLLWDNWKRASE